MKNKGLLEIREKGITIVALVVTIIVLLILASITIRLVLYNNGIISIAGESVSKWVNASTNERIATDEIRNSLSELREGRTAETETSTMTDSEENPIVLNSIVDHYGEAIVYNGKRYQLYLADLTGKYSNGEPRLWLQHKDYVSSESLPDRTTTALNDLDSTFWQINPKLKESYGTEVSTTLSGNSIPGGIRISVFLSNTANFNSTYVAEGDIEKGVYAIGGASIEMFCDSYNQARGKVSTDSDYFDVDVTKANSTYGYCVKPTSSEIYNGCGYESDCVNYPILTSTRNGMYRVEGKLVYIVSPSMIFDGGCYLYSNGTNGGCINHGWYTSSSKGYRPLISVPVGFPIEFE